MASLSNTPSQPTMLTLAARKSFSLTVEFLGSNGLPMTLAGATVSFTIGEQSYSDTPILTQQADAILDERALALINLQASQLDLVPGVYPFEIVVVASGYSSIAVNGELEIEESYEMAALGQTYDTAPSSYRLVAQLRSNRLVVTSSSLVLQGAAGPKGDDGVDGNPFAEVLITYDAEDRIESLTIGGETTTYSYNPDNTIAFDERNGVTRTYIYTGSLLTSIEPTGP